MLYSSTFKRSADEFAALDAGIPDAVVTRGAAGVALVYMTYEAVRVDGVVSTELASNSVATALGGDARLKFYKLRRRAGL